jgi:uncharacterized protein (DUF1786 family)
MRILAVDTGTVTQDILLFDSAVPIESCVKMVMPAATEIAARRIRRATLERRPVLLTGVTMGGGPCQWALQDHIKAGGTAFATQEAARTFDEDLAVVAGMGVAVVSGDEASGLRGVEQIEMRDLDLASIRRALSAFEVPSDFDGIAIGCLDHGAPPPGYPARLFRFNHLRQVMQERNELGAFAFLPSELPEYLTRARSMMSCIDVEAPRVFIDRGPAAALGALQDPRVSEHDEQVVLRLGNSHTLGFYLSGSHVHAFFEHHTDLLETAQIESMAEQLSQGTLSHEEVFGGQGHGVYYVDRVHGYAPFLAVTGPQRGRLRGSRLNPYFATPHGDMTISGCFGLVQAFAERFPENKAEIGASLSAV